MAIGENLAREILANVIPDDAFPWFGDDVVRIRVGRREWELKPVHIGEGLPADVRRWAATNGDHSSRYSGGLPVLTARRMSRGARELIDEEQLSWADASGAATIRDGEGLYISRLSLAKRILNREIAWKPALGATVEVILDQAVGDARPRVARPAWIAEKTGYTYAQVATSLAALDEQGYTAKVGAERGPSAGREIREPGRLLSDWTGFYKRALRAVPATQLHVPWRNSAQSLAAVQRTLPMRWAVSGAFAAERIAPYLTQAPDLLVYVDAESLPLARRALLTEPEIHEVESGGRIRIEGASPHVLGLSTPRDGIEVAPLIRIYGDLLRVKGRGEEAAEFVRERVIGF